MTVRTFDTIADFRASLNAARRRGETVGFVPTMGYLHDGHASLMRRAAAENDVAAASIFVNPAQFAANEDFSTYPRDIERDLALCADAGVTLAFHPPVEEVYPDGPEGRLTSVVVREVSDGMEGAARPTHFVGVATVVAKLFNITGPCRAYFGEKDWQQLQVVRQMVRDLDFAVDIVGCPIVREPDGLAMSSRNVYLSAAERSAATVLHRALLAARGAGDPETVMKEIVAGEPLATLDYAEVHGDRAVIAARFGSTRLIDNLSLTEE